MSYVALYRVYRPGRFDEMVGQEQTVTALKNAVREGKVAHAYLLSGPRGTGKTSVAKLLAKAVNCLQPEDGEPCNRCSACRDINSGAFMDVIEIDAASNRGIDEIRDLREKVRILPAQGAKKVYIIDEVHMLTTEAFNALLKTLEEPPGYVIFILATTELHKIPGTILSRCQRYAFKNLSQEQIVARLLDVALQSGIELDDEAAEIIARRAGGGMRDALAMLDQLNAYREGHIAADDVMDVLGLFDEAFIGSLVELMLNNDLAGLISSVDNAVASGRDGGQLLKDLSLYFRDMLINRLTGGNGSMMLAGDKGRAKLTEHNSRCSQDGLMRALTVAMDSVEKLRFSEERRFYLEMSLLGVARAFHEPENQSVQDTATRTEKPARKQAQERKAAANQKSGAESLSSEERDLWNRIVNRVKDMKVTTYALLKEGNLLGLKDDTYYVAFRKGFKFHKDKMEEKGNRDVAAQAIREETGRDLNLELIYLDDTKYNDIIVQKAIELFGEDMVHIKD